MCVANPTTRTAIQFSGINGPGCSGRYDFHMTHAYMGARLLQPGDIVHCQYISRDPASAPDRIALSGALRFIVKP
jgi:hypothetical protein